MDISFILKVCKFSNRDRNQKMVTRDWGEGREVAANTRNLRELSGVMETLCIMTVIRNPFVKTHQTVLLREMNLLLEV